MSLTTGSRLDGKVALITGSSAGIGAGTAIFFSKLGANLSLTARNESGLRDTAAACEKNGSKTLTIAVDITKEENMEKIIDDTIRHFGKLDILINNAGIANIGSVETLSLEQFDKVMNINLRCPFYLTKLAVPHLVKTKGNIVNVSSMTGLRAFRNRAAYATSKSAIDQFTRCTALDLAPKQVRVNSVNPGVIETGIQKKDPIGMDDEKYAEFMRHAVSVHPLGRVGQVDEVAEMIAYLASDSAGFITGINMPIDGGRSVATS